MTSFFANLSIKPQAIYPARKSLLPISASLSMLSEKAWNHARSASDRIFLKGCQNARRLEEKLLQLKLPNPMKKDMRNRRQYGLNQFRP
jgi:hypothetical protein